jgi:hypothetical protein
MLTRSTTGAAALLTVALLCTAEARAHPDPSHGSAAATTASVGAVGSPVTPARVDPTLVYEPVPGWCALPDDRPLGNTHGGIVIDAQGRVYYNTDTDRSIMVHRPDGAFIKSIAAEFPAIHGMALRTEPNASGLDEQFIYAAHLPGRQVVKLTLDGEPVWTIDTPTESGHYDGRAFNPTAVAVAPNGHVFVSDGYGQNWIHQFDEGRNYVRSFGGPGEGPGTFRTCHGMIIDPRGDEPTLLICDRENRRIQRFSLDGEFLEVVATGLRRPCALSIWGEYTAVAELEGRVTILDADFEPAASLGDNPDRSQWAKNGVPPEQWTDGVFTAPHGVCFDREGNLYVMDWNATGRISKLERVAAP